ncbi:MAG: DUF11 domain-containing protein [Gammaproteobacteria bacterium]|nr:DUF11 domain-containing protein [Gammaproteobacteria bacterium]
MSTIIFVAMLGQSPVYATPVSRTITIDGVMTDWIAPFDLTTNPGQFSTDGDGSVCPSTDLDTGTPCAVLTPSGRDLARFAYTWDTTNLYFYVERVAGTSNSTDWFFYIDVDNDGLMEAGEKVLRIAWNGNTRATSRELWDYVPLLPAGDSMAGDGYTMPGGISNKQTMAGASGGATDKLSMESWIAFSEIGLSGPQSIQFHIAAGNSTALPGGIIDNMNGPAGSGLQFSELGVSKIASVADVYGTSAFSYTITISNAGDVDATNVSVTDVLPAEVSYVSHAAGQGSYDQATGVWTIGTIPFTTPNTSISLVITVVPAAVTVVTPVTNSTSALTLDQNDSNSANDIGSVTVQLHPAPSLVVMKSVTTVTDPVNLSVNPKSIPGAVKLYQVDVTNTGTGASDADSLVVADAIPVNTEMYVASLGAGPVVFIDSGSTLAYTYTSLSSTTDSIDFSSNGGATWTYTPVADADGYDANVTNFRIRPTGSLPAAVGSTPAFSLRFQVRLK